MINAVLERCAGIDIGKKFLVACVMVGAADEEPRTEIRKFGTTVPELENLKAWLQTEGCTHAAMESTAAARRSLRWHTPCLLPCTKCSKQDSPIPKTPRERLRPRNIVWYGIIFDACKNL